MFTAIFKINVQGITKGKEYVIESYDKINGRFEVYDDDGNHRIFVLGLNTTGITINEDQE